MEINLIIFGGLKFRNMNDIKNYIEENKDRFLNELIDLLKIPSIGINVCANDGCRPCSNC